ncbi:hypothetical protein [Umezawaea sp. NPDC059074]|uniref:hypothetical protein n=1 Tax=Umezawaea sp. NPDC059074 TaxID=3346716 RepID=UPI0036BF85CE
MSRAKAALDAAKQTGDLDQVTAARERLDAARAAHRVAKTAAAAEESARHHGDVTSEQSPTTEDDPTMNDQPHQGDDHDPRPRIILHNTNIVSGNATVGSQHDVSHDSYTAEPTAADAAKQAERAKKQAKKAAKRARRAERDAHHTVNVASGDAGVDLQVGVQLGGMTITGGVGNYISGATGTINVNNVGGPNRGRARVDFAHDTVTFGQPPRTGHSGDVTPPTTNDPHTDDHGTRIVHTPDGTTRVDPDGYVESIRDGQVRFRGHVSGEIWVDGQRLR